MKLEEGEYLVNVATCTENDDVLLATHHGKCIRFSANDIRVFVGRNSMGVRGIKLMPTDYVMSMSILKHADFTVEERNAYLRKSRSLRDTADVDLLSYEAPKESDEEEGAVANYTLTDERFKEMAGQEQFLLSVAEKGYGKRSSSYEYRLSGRGGQGIANMEITDKTGLIVGCFPVEDSDQLMLMTDGGQLIRCRVNEVRIVGRKTQGVTLFRVTGKEKVVAAERVPEEEDEE
jgi:DNA gyrase subunit A